MEELLTKAEAASLFKVSPRTIDRWRSRGLLKAFALTNNTVRFRHEDLDALVSKKLKHAFGPRPAAAAAG